MIPSSVLGELTGFTAQAFFAGLWQGGLLLAAVGIAFRLLPRVGPALRFAGWAFAFGLAAVLPVLRVGGRSAAHSALHLSPVWGYAIAGVWIALMLRGFAQLLVEAVRLRGMWRRAVPVAAEAEIQTLLEAAPRRAQLCVSADVDSPSVIGFFEPRLLVPKSLYPQLSALELRQIVLHECEHLRRRDDWINLGQKVALAVFPLNPALWWVDRRLGLERELACDAGVVAATTAPFDYAHCLTRLAEHRLMGRRVALALSAWSRQSELARRVHTLLRPMASLSVMQARAVVALLAICLVGGGMEMARVPQLVAFTQAAVPSELAEVESGPAGRAIPVVFHEDAEPGQMFPSAGFGVVASPHPAGAKARGFAGRNVRAEARTYVRGNGVIGVRGNPVETRSYEATTSNGVAGTNNNEAFAAIRSIGGAQTGLGGASEEQAYLRAHKESRAGVGGEGQPQMLLTLEGEPSPGFQQPTPVRRIETIQIERVGTEQVQVRRIVAVEFSPSYAAVPYGDGWLIVKL